MWLIFYSVAVSSFGIGLGGRFAPVARSVAPQCRVITYTREEGDTAPVDVAKVEEMIFQRTHHRQDRNFAEADAIQDELLRMGVTVFDRERKWFVGTGQRGGGGQERSSGRWASYSREAGDVYPVDVQAVEPTPPAAVPHRAVLRLSSAMGHCFRPDSAPVVRPRRP